jgi:hypothetical protein
VLNGLSRIRSAIRHVRVEGEAWLIGLVASGEGDTVRSRSSTAGDVEVEAMEVHLDLILESSLLELVHVSVQGNELSSQNIRTWLDVAWQLELEAVAIIGSKLVGPSIYEAC